MLLFANSKTGVAGHLVERHLGVAYKAAYRMCDRIRTHMALLEGSRTIGGPGIPVFVDEALLNGIRTDGLPGKGKAIAFGMTDGQTVVSVVVPDRKAATLYPIIAERVRPGSIIITDGYHTYRRLSAAGWRHSIVNHSRGEWVNREGYSQASIESYWAILKRTIRGTHLHVNRRNLWKYIGEFNFRYNRRAETYRIFSDMVNCFPPFVTAQKVGEMIDPVRFGEGAPDMDHMTDGEGELACA